MKKNHIVTATIVVMAAIFVVAAFIYSGQQAAEQNQRAAEHAKRLVPDHAMRKGNPDAKVTIVEFLDPACGTCKQFHPLVKDLLKKYQGKVNLVVRYAPLHPGSDQMVAILEAAKKQNQFWNVLDLMFETQQAWAINHVARADLFWGYLKGYGFDVAKIEEEMQTAEVQQVIQKDIEDGQLLGATKTPTFFVNGKPLPSFGYEQLVQLIESEVAANY